MYRSKGRFILGVSLALAICLTAATSTFAATPVGAKTAYHFTAAEITMAEKATTFTQITQQGYVLDEAGALKAGLPAGFVAQLDRTYDRVNQSASERHYDWSRFQQDVAQLSMTTGVGQPSGGSISVAPDSTTSVGVGWAGVYSQVSFTEYETKLIIDAVTGCAIVAGGYAATAALATLLSAGFTLPGAVVAGFVGAACAAGAWALTSIDDWGANKGIYFRDYVLSGLVTIWHN